MLKDLIKNKKVAFYTGCFTNYYYPEVGKTTTKIFHKSGIEVVVPDQVCCGLPMLAKGNTKRAYKNMEYNSSELSRLVSDGYILVTTCPSCALFIKRDYPLLLGSEKAKLVSENIFYITRYLLLLYGRGELNTDFRSTPRTVFYHSPCHLRAQGPDNATVKMLKLIPDIGIKHVSEECCGLAGGYGYEKVNYQRSREIAAKLYTEIKENNTDQVVTDCGGCKLQIEAGSGRKVDHPIILIQEAYNL